MGHRTTCIMPARCPPGFIGKQGMVARELRSLHYNYLIKKKKKEKKIHLYLLSKEEAPALSMLGGWTGGTISQSHAGRGDGAAPQ